jgi:hypothetical protein
MDSARRAYLVNMLFDKNFMCQCAPVYLDVAFPPPKPRDREVFDGRYGASGCVMTVDYSNERHVLDAMFAHTRYSGNQEDDDRLAQTPVEMGLTVNQMAEVLAVDGSFTFLNPPDCTEISDLINEYMVGLQQAQRYEVHYPMPPKEDLEKLSRLDTVLQPMVTVIRNHGMGTGAWDEIERLFTVGKVEGRLSRQTPPEPVKVSRGEAPAISNTNYKQHKASAKDPFSF